MAFDLSKFILFSNNLKDSMLLKAQTVEAFSEWSHQDPNNVQRVSKVCRIITFVIVYVELYSKEERLSSRDKLQLASSYITKHLLSDSKVVRDHEDEMLLDHMISTLVWNHNQWFGKSWSIMEEYND